MKNKKGKNFEFVKMSGAGNDFVIMEDVRIRKLAELTRRVCDRTEGIGADGLMLLGKSRKADFRMRIINADGTEAEMCGNGARCMAAYIVRYKKPRKKVFTIETMAGVLQAEAQGETATVTLTDPCNYRPDIAMTVAGRKIRAQYIDTGVPHVVIPVNILEKIDVDHIGRMVRNHRKFKPRGANVNFIEFEKEGLLKVRTYERGVEAETWACGTGAVASAIVAFLQQKADQQSAQDARMRVRTRNGDILTVVFDLDRNILRHVRLTGPAKFIAQGRYFY
ncbi:MAG: diaminopimelate epimerase [Candidatus Omnitrophota bacterium]